jgi:iron complex outermembrane recepter protein
MFVSRNTSSPWHAVGPQALGIFILSSALAGPCLAATAATDTPMPQAAAAESQEPEGLAEVIVTANKREENLQKTDVSISVVSESSLAARNISDPGQLNALVPGVSIQPSFILLTYIRGLGNYSSQPGVDQTVAYNVDGIYISKPYGMPTLLFDLDRIEMLRGPQGTLQGRNATAGSLDFVTAKPEDQFDAKTSLAYGAYHQINTEGMVNIPLAEGYALRISGATAQHQGYFDNGYGDQDVAGARIRFLAKPIDGLTALITGEYTDRHEKGETYSPCPPGSTAAEGCAGVRWNPWAGTPGQGTSDALNLNEPNLLDSTNSAIYGQIDYDFGFATLTWIPNFRHWYYKDVQTLSGTFGYAPAVIDNMHSEELRLASDSGSRIAWVAGINYGRESEPGEQNYFLTNQGPFVTIDRSGFPPIGHVYYKNDIYSYTYESKAAFAHVSLPLFIDRFRFVGGLRYTNDKKNQEGNAGVVVAGPTLLSVDVGGHLDTNELTYKAGLEYDLASDKMIYANISTGYKAGGVNGVPPGSNIPATFQPETITAYETGIKSRFLDNRMQVNSEVFFYNYYGYQTSFFASTSDGVLIGATTNSQKARLYGGELESAFLVTPQDQLSLSLTGLSAIYTEFVIPANNSNLSGTPLQDAPKWTFTADYNHTFKLPRSATLVPHFTAHYETGQWVDYRHSPGSYSPAHWRCSSDLAFNSPDGKYHVSAYVDNIFNNDALLVANSGLGPYQLAEPYPPRTYGLRLTANF